MWVWENIQVKVWVRAVQDYYSPRLFKSPSHQQQIKLSSFWWLGCWTEGRGYFGGDESELKSNKTCTTPEFTHGFVLNFFFLQIKIFPKCFLLIWLLCASFFPYVICKFVFLLADKVFPIMFFTDMAFVCGCNCASDIVVHRGIGSFHRKWFPIPQYECQKKKHSLLPEFKIFF